MKKIEAIELAPERSKLIIEYIIQILSDPEQVNARMDFNVVKIDNQMMCVLDIYVPKRGFEKHLNLGITSEHDLILYEQLLNDLLDTFLEHETIGITKYYSLKSMQENFTGIDAINTLGSKIKINLNSSGTDFMELIDKYSKRYDELLKNLDQGQNEIELR